MPCKAGFTDLKILITVIFLLYNILLPQHSSAQVLGCTDHKALNFNPAAKYNDGSCFYEEIAISPLSSFELSNIISETSGLIYWDNRIWTINDSDDTNVYSLDTLDGNIIHPYPLNGTDNTDWEEISQDDEYLYIGDTGNNQNGNRTDLKILRISKSSLPVSSPGIDTIYFSYSDQSDFSPAGANNTDFDCEAFIVSADSIYLFTKQWVKNGTAVYSLPKSPGRYTAKLKTSYNIDGMVTGSVFLESKKLIAICGYDAALQPFIYLLYDFNGTDFFSGNKRKIMISLPFHQIEGITTSDGKKYYLTNEQLIYEPLLNIKPQLHIVDLGSFLDVYLNSFLTMVRDDEVNYGYKIYPVPADYFLIVETDPVNLPSPYSLISQSGRALRSGIFTEEFSNIDVSGLPEGLYILNTGKNRKHSFKFLRK